jgi:RNA recognition motif-containing protein
VKQKDTLHLNDQLYFYRVFRHSAHHLFGTPTQGDFMGIKLYVGNLSYGVQSNDLNDFFAQYGTVTSAKIITDRDTGRSKGFGFVEMDDETEGRNAIEQGNGQDFNGRNIKITEALPQESKGPRTGGFNRSESSRGPKRW